MSTEPVNLKEHIIELARVGTIGPACARYLAGDAEAAHEAMNELGLDTIAIPMPDLQALLSKGTSQDEVLGLGVKAPAGGFLTPTTMAGDFDPAILQRPILLPPLNEQTEAALIARAKERGDCAACNPFEGQKITVASWPELGDDVDPDFGRDVSPELQKAADVAAEVVRQELEGRQVPAGTTELLDAIESGQIVKVIDFGGPNEQVVKPTIAEATEVAPQLATPKFDE